MKLSKVCQSWPRKKFVLEVPEDLLGGGHVERGDDQVGALLLAHGVSQDSARVRITHGTQVDPALGAPQVGQIRDPHPIQGTLIPLAGAVVLMGHRTPPAAPGRARVRVQA